MKKWTLIALIIVLGSSFAFSQDYAVDEGSMIISGMASYNSQGGDLFENNDGDRTTTLMLAPIVNYFVKPNISVGGGLAYTSQSQGDNSYHTIGIGPTVGYFIGDSNSKNFPYLAAGIRYYSMGDKDDSISGTDIVIGVGVLTPVKNHMGIVVEAGYHIMNLKHKDWEESQSGNMIMIGVGIAGILY